MAKGTGGGETLQGTLMDAAQAITRAMGTPEAAHPQIAAALGKLQGAVLTLARGGNPTAPGAPPPPGAPPGAGPAGGAAANPQMPSLGGPTPPGAGATMNVPQMPPDELRRVIAQNV